jgi:chorismate mutase
MESIKLEQIKIGNKDLKRPIIISGPCSAETEEQTLKTAHELAAQGIEIFRAGIWKPRTRPGSFEGVKNTGLSWLKRVKKETSMAVGTEVATALHVYQALKFGIDVIWIGARTTANPFAVQEIADALEGVDIPVLVKNPVNPDLNLWIGAIERIHRAGIKKVAAIHRGFSTYLKVKYRNEPQWQIPIELKRRIPEIQIITDPSHISGKRALLQEVSQQAMDLNFDGLMIESHFDPNKAWSDAEQQITPATLKQLLNNLVIRQTNGKDLQINLETMRHDIDQLDKDLWAILEKRMKLSKRIGIFKKENNLTILQAKRYDEIMNQRVQMGVSKGFSNEFSERLFKNIHEESIRHQKYIMNKPNHQ